MNFLARFGPEDNSSWRQATFNLSQAKSDEDISKGLAELANFIQATPQAAKNIRKADLKAMAAEKKKAEGGDTWGNSSELAFTMLLETLSSLRPVICGIDLGTSEVVAAVCDAFGSRSARIVRNDLSNWGTPTMISFHGKSRELGEHAVDKLRLQPDAVLTDLVRLLGISKEEYVSLTEDSQMFNMAENSANNSSQVAVNFRGESLTIPTEAAVAMILRRVLGFVEESEGDGPAHLIVAVPSFYTPKQYAALLDACKIAGLETGDSNSLRLVDSLTCAATQWMFKHYTTLMPETPTNVLIVNIGASITSIGMFAVTPKTIKPLATASSPKVGAGVIDDIIFKMVVKECAQKGVKVAPRSRLWARILKECEKAKKVLSTVAIAPIDIEHVVGEDGSERDVRLKISRAQVEEASEKLRAELKELLISVIYSSGVNLNDCRAIELIGGGTRIPWVKSLIFEIGGDRLAYTLDGSHSVATGAAILASHLQTVSKEIDGVSVQNDGAAAPGRELVVDLEKWKADVVANAGSLPGEVIEKCIGFEEKMLAQEHEVREATAARNRLESFLYELRGGLNGPHKKHLKDDVVNSLVLGTEDWMWAADDRSAAEYDSKLQDVKGAITEACPEYFAAVEAERKKIEEELAKDAAAAAAEAAAEGGDDDDHDRRKLKKGDRMRLVMKNKDEGNELFKGGNLEMAAVRYIKALNHCTKFFDLDDDGKKEVDTTKLSLYLNLSQCYLKLENWRQAAENCKSALLIDPESVKALYRKAVAEEAMKNYAEALKDLQKAAKIAPSDPLIQRLQKKLDLIQAKQKEKEKKMAQKMFGGF